MVVLGFDTATAATAVAVARDGHEVVAASIAPAPGEDPRHSEDLLPEIDRAVTAAGGWEEIDRIAVGVGPGRYTGLRVGIATARALAQALEKPLAGVSSLAALAAGMRAAAAGESPGGLLLPVLDARRAEAFAALHRSCDMEQVWEPFVTSPGDLAERIAGLEEAPLAGGDGALRFREELEAAGARIPSPPDPVHSLSAYQVCALGSAAELSEVEAVQPVYLREPDARRWIRRDRDAAGRGEPETR
jgi:tRNA threonylcarbamoyladenosine biosynthesis protein TsaB